jgi:hypothetical protein
MPKYEVAFTQAGPFKQGEVVTDEQIKKAGLDPEFWVGNGAVKAVEEKAAPAAAPAAKSKGAPPAPAAQAPAPAAAPAAK